MRIKRLNGMFTVASQLEVLKVRMVAEAGYKSIICNRPDCEGGAQPYFADIAREAEKHGIEARYMPLKPSDDPKIVLDDFIAAIDEMPKPILAYCRSGTRPATLWSKWEHAMSGGLPDRGEKRTGAMKSGAFEGGGMSITGKRASPPLSSCRADGPQESVVPFEEGRRARG